MKKLFDARVDIIDPFEKGIFTYKDNAFKTKKVESEENKFKKIKDDSKKFIRYIEDESKGIDYDLFEDYFSFSVPSALAKQLYEIKNRRENDGWVELIRARWSNLKDKIEKMSKKNIENEKPGKMLKIVEEILKFNREKQLGQGLKILTPNQMLSRSPITLAQLKARNNSEKLKNEIRQFLYSLYRPKKLTKQLYKSLIDII